MANSTLREAVADLIRDSRAPTYERIADEVIALVLEAAARLTISQAQIFRDEAQDQKVWGNGAMSNRALAIASYFDMHAATIRALKERKNDA